MSVLRICITDYNLFYYRSNEFKEDDAIWKGGEDGGVEGEGDVEQCAGAQQEDLGRGTPGH